MKIPILLLLSSLVFAADSADQLYRSVSDYMADADARVAKSISDWAKRVDVTPFPIGPEPQDARPSERNEWARLHAVNRQLGFIKDWRNNPPNGQEFLSWIKRWITLPEIKKRLVPFDGSAKAQPEETPKQEKKKGTITIEFDGKKVER
jgi:hypothetical protein